MQINIIYTIALASLFGLLLLWKLLSLVEISTRQLILSYLRKRFLYTLVYHRRAGTDDINVASTINIIVLVAANMTACIYGLPDRIELARRCGALFLLNATPLLLGGRTSFLIDRIMILKPNQQSLLHRWMGRVCVLQGLIHGGISAASSSPTTLLQKALLSVVAVLGIASFLYIRRYMYEIFLKTHLLLAVAIVVILWFHIPLSSRFNVIVLGVASGMWLIQQVFWLTRLCYRNLGSGSSMVTSFKEYSSHDPSSEGMGITLKLKRPWKVRPGQYVYLTLPNISRHHGGFLQAHPYAIAWMEGSDISLIVQRQSGFSNDVFRATGRHTSVIVDGPYGQPQQFMCYDKVLFIASGIGVAAHLLAIRDLLEAHENRSARVRRITLLWFLETMDQEQWAKHFIVRLFEEDKHRIFTLVIYVPHKSILLDPTSRHYNLERSIFVDEKLNLAGFIENESLAEAGNMSVSVCGPPHFGQCVRRGIRLCKQSIHCFYTAFNPEETNSSKASQVRYS